MRICRYSSLIAVCAAVITLLISAPASAFSIFGVTVGQTSSPTQNILQTRSSTDNSNTYNDSYANELPCLRFTNHEYEVCSAYVYNSSFITLVPYYKYAHIGNESITNFVNYRLGIRYVGAANSLITNRVAQWPTGENEVNLPRISILSVHSSLATNSATLTTRESWRVTDQNGTVLYQETNKIHTVTMARVPGFLLHIWIVTNIQ